MKQRTLYLKINLLNMMMLSFILDDIMQKNIIPALRLNGGE